MHTSTPEQWWEALVKTLKVLIKFDKLIENGWNVGDAKHFLGLSPEEEKAVNKKLEEK